MSGEMRVPTSDSQQRGGWSLETAIDHLLALINEKYAHILALIAGNDKRYEERFSASQKALELGLAGTKSEISAALAAADRAVAKAEAASEKRFEGVNEFRETLSDQQRTLMPRAEVEVIVKGLEEKIGNARLLIDEMRSRERVTDGTSKGVRDGWGFAVGVAGLVLAVVTIIWRLSTP